MAWCEEKKKRKYDIKKFEKILYFRKIEEEFQICYMKNG